VDGLRKGMITAFSFDNKVAPDMNLS